MKTSDFKNISFIYKINIPYIFLKILISKAVNI